MVEFKGFKKRYQVTHLLGRNYSIHRIVDKVQLSDWLHNFWRDIIDVYDIPPYLMFNYDETFIELDDMKNIKVLVPNGSVPVAASKKDTMHTSFGVTIYALIAHISHTLWSRNGA